MHWFQFIVVPIHNDIYVTMFSDLIFLQVISTYLIVLQMFTEFRIQDEWTVYSMPIRHMCDTV